MCFLLDLAKTTSFSEIFNQRPIPDPIQDECWHVDERQGMEEDGEHSDVEH